MRPAPFQSWSDPRNEHFRRRAVSLALAGAVHVLILLLLLKIAPPFPPPRPPAGRILAFDLPAEKQVSADSSKAEEARRETSRPAPDARELVVPEPVIALPPTTGSAAADAVWAKVTPLTRRELADADSALSKAGEASESNSDGRQGASTQSVGTGPNGQPLFAADWYRPPTDAELAPYIPAGAPREGWGMIACQTMPGFRVDNCSTIGQHPPGSGLANAVLNAAWQFRVLPPRIGGRPMVGAWVRIRIDYTRRGAG